MNLAIALAEAARVDTRGPISVLGLGATRLEVTQLPGQFHGSLIVIATPEAGDLLENEFSLTLQVPAQQPQQFALGTFKAGGLDESVIMAHTFDMLLVSQGDYVFRMLCGKHSAATKLIVKLQEPEAAGGPSQKGGA